jgi:signal transduction histidine kinase
LIGVRGPLRSKLEAALAVELTRQARLIAQALEGRPSGLNLLAHRYGALLGRRVTFIALDGRVLGDSDFDDASLRLLANHLDRPEVMEALSSGTGVDHRLSESTHRPELKVAISAWPGVVRVSAPLAEVDAAVGAVERTILLAAAAALLMGTVLAALGGRAVSRPLRELGRAARSVAAGEPPEYPVSSAPEIRHLVATLRGMQEELGVRIAELQRERDESDAIIESMAEGVIAADAHGNVVAANAAVRRLLGYVTAQSLPNLQQLFRPRAVRQVIEEVLAGAPVLGREAEVEGRTILLTGRPLPKGGAVLVLHDVTDLKRVDMVRRDFVANVSHELKTPLTSISGYAETLLAETPDDATQKRFLDVIAANATRMQHLVDDLLDLARLESGQWQVQPQTTELAAVGHDAFAELAERAAGRNVGFNAELADGATVWVDPEALRQILANLFDNALRHTPTGGRIVLTSHAGETAVEVSVRDTGSGIPHEHLPRVFERFYRVDPGRSREQGGTGLGLAIVKHLVEAHGGSVSIESTVGIGTAVRMRFPNPPAEG